MNRILPFGVLLLSTAVMAATLSPTQVNWCKDQGFSDAEECYRELDTVFYASTGSAPVGMPARAGGGQDLIVQGDTFRVVNEGRGVVVLEDREGREVGVIKFDASEFGVQAYVADFDGDRLDDLIIEGDSGTEFFGLFSTEAR